ncbi:TRADD-N-associated membrane domain-containing protein [Streptomyces sp. NPDC002405]|uniref:TRADD-N-associated membrane domain-containing protein n=1 Tax=unclassified Streptomyces TaxID=2593676 RepID=UPI003696CCA8
MDPVSLVITALASRAGASLADHGSDAWKDALYRLRARTSSETEPPAGDHPPVHPPQPEPAPPIPEAPRDGTAQAALSQVLEGYYKKVGRRADVSFFAALIAAVVGYIVIGGGIWLGVHHSDDQALAVVTTAGGIFSQVLSFFFFRNRAEERKMMIQVLADLRQDAEADAKVVRALELIEQVQQPLLRDNLTAAVALELSNATADLKSIHSALKLFDTNGERQSDGHRVTPLPPA